MTANWEEILKDRLLLYGHRNWVVIADSAYPAQSRQAIETIAANDEQTTVLARTLAALSEFKHVKPKICLDEELNFVAEKDAPGVSSYRERLRTLLKDREVRTFSHEEIIARLDQAGEMFRVLLVKTNMRIPYTSVFFELDCGYWNAEAEDRLRAAMRQPTNDHGRSATKPAGR